MRPKLHTSLLSDIGYGCPDLFLASSNPASEVSYVLLGSLARFTSIESSVSNDTQDARTFWSAHSPKASGSATRIWERLRQILQQFVLTTVF